MTTDFASRGTLYFEDALGRNTALPSYPQGNQRLGYSQFLGKCGLRGFPAAQECLEVHKQNITIRDCELQEFYYDSSVPLSITASNNYPMDGNDDWRSRVKRALKQQKRDQGWLAEQLGIAQPTVSAKLNGKRGASLAEIDAMADALRLDRGFVTHGDAHKPKDDTEILTAADMEMVDFGRRLDSLPDTDEYNIWRNVVRGLMRSAVRATSHHRGFPRGEPPATTITKRKHK